MNYKIDDDRVFCIKWRPTCGIRVQSRPKNLSNDGYCFQNGELMSDFCVSSPKNVPYIGFLVVTICFSKVKNTNDYLALIRKLLCT